MGHCPRGQSADGDVCYPAHSSTAVIQIKIARRCCLRCGNGLSSKAASRRGHGGKDQQRDQEPPPVRMALRLRLSFKVGPACIAVQLRYYRGNRKLTAMTLDDLPAKSPNPGPIPCGFVVTNASNRSANRSGWIPGPLSNTSTIMALRSKICSPFQHLVVTCHHRHCFDCVVDQI